jgi:hypothetical protein
MAKINNDIKEIMTDLVKLLVKLVQSEGGDGGAKWYSGYYDLEDIIVFIKNNNLIPDYWEIQKCNWTLKNGEIINYYNLGENQEWLSITDNQELFEHNLFGNPECAIKW